MIKAWEKKSRKQKILFFMLVFLAVLGLFFLWISSRMESQLWDQQGALRWGDEKTAYAQVSAFIPADQNIKKDNIPAYRSMFQKSLDEASITSSSKDENARLWVDAYSVQGSFVIENGKNSVEVSAMGVGGDFFLFHPQQLLYGNYISEQEVMKDRLVIDEETAWSLFGSSDIAGQQITILGKKYLVAGVFKSRENKSLKKAKEGLPQVFLLYDTMTAMMGEALPVACYEILLPNPVSGFAKQMVIKNILGIDLSQGDEETNKENLQKADIQIMENSSRFGLPALLRNIGSFGSRSMVKSTVEYPYWENEARAAEDYASLFLIAGVLALVFPAGRLLIYSIRRYKKRKWTWKHIRSIAENRIEMRKERKWEEKKNEKI